ncbi:MAG TPA: hypothetical protein P5509_09080, partial [Bacteroidales bacterium]|nr:hypothetical protein [Bacteroidales bacterium]
MKTVQFGTFLQNLAQRVGLDISGEQYKDLISANLQIPEDVANKIFAGTLTVDAAVNNPEVRKRLIPELLNPVDKELLALAK